MNASAPAERFDVLVSTSRGDFTVHVNSSWAPPMARRFFILSQLAYFDGAPFYRVLRVNASTQFVAQFGYRGVPQVDDAWVHYQTSNATAAVAPPGNARGTVAFGTYEVANSGGDPNCTAPQCSLGFSVELFINLADNTRLDAADFSPFGWVDEGEMGVVDALYAGYGECADLCDASPDPYCEWDDVHKVWRGVNFTRMLSEGWSYLGGAFPFLDRVLEMRHVELNN